MRTQAKRDADSRYYATEAGRANRMRKKVQRRADSVGVRISFPTGTTVTLSLDDAEILLGG